MKPDQMQSIHNQSELHTEPNIHVTFHYTQNSSRKMVNLMHSVPTQVKFPHYSNFASEKSLLAAE